MHSARYSRQILMQLQFSRYIFQKSSSIKFHESPSNGSKAVPCAHTERERESQLIVVFRNFARAPKNKISSY
jgi:hypothetical protein